MKLPPHLSAAAPLLGLFPAMADVTEFHQTFGHPIATRPNIPPPERQVLRSKLIREEYHEFSAAWHRCAELSRSPVPPGADLEVLKTDIIKAIAGMADALADLIYVINGCALEYGIPLHLVWAAVQKANMSKVWKTEPTLGDVTALYGPGCRIEPCSGGWVVYDAQGKVRKPAGWKEPDIVAIICRAIDPSDIP